MSGGESAELRSAAVKMVFVKEESEEDTSEPEPWRIKQEEPEPWIIKQEEQGGLVKVKEEQDLNEVEEKHQDQKDHVANGEKSVSCSKPENSCSQSDMKITKVKRPFTCSESGKSFTQKAHLMDHLVTHSSEKPFSCSECGKSFTRKGYLETHMLIHTGIKPFTCSQCGNSFRQRGHLWKHMKMHNRIKPLTCTECGNTFKQKRSLEKHMMIVHTEKKPVFHSECGNICKHKGSLKNHLLIHTGKRPFSCSQCYSIWANQTNNCSLNLPNQLFIRLGQPVHHGHALRPLRPLRPKSMQTESPPT